jgi:hypothetical protein
VTRTRQILMLVLALCALLIVPGAASASSDDVIQDCAEDGRLDHHYSPGELADAEHNIPTDVDEYTDCRQVISAARNRANRRGSGGGGSGGSGGGSGSGGDSGISATDPSLITDSGAVAASGQDLAALDNERRLREGDTNAPEVNIGGRPVVPGPNGVTDVATAANEVPPPLIAALAGFCALALGAALLLMRRRWPQTRRAASRIFRR